MRIGVLCSGGDAPGMNPCLRAIVRTALTRGDEVVGIKRGYEGLLNEDFWTESDNQTLLNLRSVSGLVKVGGTILNSSRSKRMMTPEGLQLAADMLRKNKIDALLPIGGNGTQAGAKDLMNYWDGQIIGIPATIDNDLLGTDYTIGFWTAVNTVVGAIDKLRDTAGSHDMMFLVEVMGRHCGDIALLAAIASGSEIVCIPERPDSADEVVEQLKQIKKNGKTSVMMVVAEGDEFGGVVKWHDTLKAAGCPFEMRIVILGHVQRGGDPCPNDRLLATQLGYHAVDALHSGETGKLVGMVSGDVKLTPFHEIVTTHRKVSQELLDLLETIAS